MDLSYVPELNSNDEFDQLFELRQSGIDNELSILQSPIPHSTEDHT